MLLKSMGFPAVLVVFLVAGCQSTAVSSGYVPPNCGAVGSSCSRD